MDEQQAKPPLDWRDLQARPFTLEDMAELLAASNDVVNNWGIRSVAPAVNRLREALEELGAREEEVEDYEEYDDEEEEEDDEDA
jgi:hypothetical protein